MKNKQKLLVFSTWILVIFIAFIALRGERIREFISSTVTGKAVLGNSTDDIVITPAPPLGQTHFSQVLSPIGDTPMSVSTRIAPTAFDNSVVHITHPPDISEGESVTFTWEIHGPPKTIHTTSTYFGLTSTPGNLVKSVLPANTYYTDSLGDFMEGEFTVPLRFIGSKKIMVPGTYYFRSYALIGSQQYWSDEQTFTVIPIPKHEIRVVDRPALVKAGQNATFTWEIYGPIGTSGFTAIVGGKESKPGILDTSIDLPKTPYSVLVNDFTNGTYNVPLRFVGNITPKETGVYYYRALAFVKNKNIWSEEYSYTVE